MPVVTITSKVQVEGITTATVAIDDVTTLTLQFAGEPTDEQIHAAAVTYMGNKVECARLQLEVDRMNEQIGIITVQRDQIVAQIVALTPVSTVPIAVPAEPLGV
jgi:hypothetical protein